MYSIFDMRIFFDTEFMDDGKTIDLISIGLVAEDGREYYAVSAESDFSKANDWVKANVLPHIGGNRKTRRAIAAEIVEFAGPKPEFWAWYAAYDWVVLCQLYGRMIDVPAGWPMFCRDVKQIHAAHGFPPIPFQTSQEHNALEDARYTRLLWQRLTQKHG